MRKIIALIATLLCLGALAAPAQAQVAIERVDTPQVCDWTVSNYGTNNGFYLINNATHRIRLDYVQQVRRAPGCVDQWRGKLNLFCYEGVSPSDCSVNGVSWLIYNDDNWAYEAHPEGTLTGVMTWYVGWYDFPGVGSIVHKAWFQDAEVGNTYYNVADGFYGRSKECIRSGPPIGGTVSLCS